MQYSCIIYFVLTQLLIDFCVFLFYFQHIMADGYKDENVPKILFSKRKNCLTTKKGIKAL